MVDIFSVDFNFLSFTLGYFIGAIMWQLGGVVFLLLKKH